MWIIVIVAVLIIVLFIYMYKNGKIIIRKSVKESPNKSSTSAKISVTTEYTAHRPVVQSADDDFENTYSYKADSLMGKYEDACKKVEDAFYDTFDLKKRIKLLETAIQKYNEWKSFCYEKGDGGKKYFDDAYSVYSSSTFSPVKRDFSGDYVPEYENAEFCNLGFLESILNDYLENPKNATEHLKNEFIFYCGGLENYEFMMQVENLPKEIMRIVKKNDGILQKDIYQMYDPEMRSYIQKAIKDLSEKGKIIAMKSGNSYMLSIRK